MAEVALILGFQHHTYCTVASGATGQVSSLPPATYSPSMGWGVPPPLVTVEHGVTSGIISQSGDRQNLLQTIPTAAFPPSRACPHSS